MINLDEAEFKPMGKGDLATFLSIHSDTLRLRFEAMEEDGVIGRGWRRLRTLSTGHLRAYFKYYGEVNEMNKLIKKTK